MVIKHETITVNGTVLYCDGCGVRGPESAYDNVGDTWEQAEMDGWEDFDHRELCAACVKKGKVAAAAAIKKPKTSKKAT